MTKVLTLLFLLVAISCFSQEINYTGPRVMEKLEYALPEIEVIKKSDQVLIRFRSNVPCKVTITQDGVIMKNALDPSAEQYYVDLNPKKGLNCYSFLFELENFLERQHYAYLKEAQVYYGEDESCSTIN